MKDIVLPQMDPAQVNGEIGKFVVQQVLKVGGTGCVVGLSGGVDSTTTAAIIKSAFEERNASGDGGLELVGYILPSSTNHPKDTEDGLCVARRLNIRHEVINLQPLVEAYRATNPEAFVQQYDKGNLTSRIRATVLNTKAATENKIVAGTGNRDEDYGIGYYTLFGDGAVHLSPIAGLSKRLVRQMACYHGFSDLAHREPTAGLEPQQTDFKDLGYRYDVVELVSEGLDQGMTAVELREHKQVISMIRPQIEEYHRTFGAPKFTEVAAVVDDVYRRNRIAQSKAEIIHPPVPIVTLRYE